MVKKIKAAVRHNIPFWVCLSVSIALIVAGFCVPPMGLIDPSVLTAVGEMFGFAALYTLWLAIQKGATAKVNHGKTSLSVGNHDQENHSDQQHENDGNGE